MRFQVHCLAHASLLAAFLAVVSASVSAGPPPTGFQATDLTIGVENSLTKVFCDEPFTGKISDTLDLSAAKNEYEAGQIVLIGGANGIAKVSLEFSDLVHENRKGTIPRDNCRYNFVGYTTPTCISSKDVLAARKITDNTPKRYPDPLLVDEACALKPNSVQPVWVDGSCAGPNPFRQVLRSDCGQGRRHDLGQGPAQGPRLGFQPSGIVPRVRLVLQ